MDRYTNMMELVISFRNFVKAPNKLGSSLIASISCSVVLLSSLLLVKFCMLAALNR
jgi:hypothetical protein